MAGHGGWQSPDGENRSEFKDWICEELGWRYWYSFVKIRDGLKKVPGWTPRKSWAAAAKYFPRDISVVPDPVACVNQALGIDAGVGTLAEQKALAEKDVPPTQIESKEEMGTEARLEFDKLPELDGDITKRELSWVTENAAHRSIDVTTAPSKRAVFLWKEAANNPGSFLKTFGTRMLEKENVSSEEDRRLKEQKLTARDRGKMYRDLAKLAERSTGS